MIINIPLTREMTQQLAAIMRSSVYSMAENGHEKFNGIHIKDLQTGSDTLYNACVSNSGAVNDR